MSLEFKINQKKVIQITNNMLNIFQKMEEDTKEFSIAAKMFHENMSQSEISKNAIDVANEILNAVTKAEAIIKESVSYTKDSAILIDKAEDLGKKIRENR